MRRLLAVLLWLWAASAAAQERAALVADSLFVSADGLLVAEGNVQAFYRGTTLSAARITYDRNADRLLIEGPIFVRDADGTVLTANRAELDPRLENGLLTGARLVLDRQLQLAASRVDRVEGNLTALTQATASSCQVCPGREPIWEIRANRVVHDEVEQQLYFDSATLRVRGVPILWLPRLRLPDPENERASGFLVPSIRTTDQLGVGVKLPYFQELGPSRDLTLTPYLSPRTTTLEARYRQAFLSGDLLLQGAVSRDDIDDDGLRAFGEAAAAFDLGRDVVLTFAGTTVSDRGYLYDYGYSDVDRLETTLEVARVGERSLFRSDLTYYRSLREGEDEESLPPLVGSLSWERRFLAFGGSLDLAVDADAFRRFDDGAGADARDLSRAGASADWRRRWVLAAGVLAEGEARGDLDAYRIVDDRAFPDALLRAVPAAAVTLRWPLVRRGAGSASDLIEPVTSLGWTAVLGDAPPNEDSRLVEFDFANLHALTRFPGEDSVEGGGRASLGVQWTRVGRGYASTLGLGRVVRSDPSDATEASGLVGTTSDLLASAGFDFAGGYALDARSLLAGSLGAPQFGKSEARVIWSNALVDLSAAYLYLPADRAEERPSSAAEWTVDAEWRPSVRWSFQAGARYDVANTTPARASAGLGWRNECVEVDLSVVRRYTSPGSVEPSTDFGFSVNLGGFSVGGRTPVAPGACRG